MDRRKFIVSSSVAFAGALAASALPTVSFAAGRKGTFTGDSNHVTKGSVEVKDGKIVLKSSFWFDGAPDPRVALGKGGKFSEGTDFAVLQSNTGKQSYTIPAGINAEDYDTVVIWCRKFSVPLGHAKIR
ncbi:MAG: DM13 domain-containing protein [Pseudomonadota bacterium]